METRRLRLIELDLPLVEPFRTASGTMNRRRVVFVGLAADDAVGWGEAAPYPGHSVESSDDVWDALTGGKNLPPSAQAALEAASEDLLARLAGVPLWRRIGGTGNPVPGSVAVGVTDDPVAAVASAVADGYRAVKMKIRPGTDLAPVRSVRERFPALTIGVDANGAYIWDERSVLLDLDALEVAYVEQPFAAHDLEAHRRLRDEMVAAVALDESIESTEAAIRAMEWDAADLLVLKPGRIGLDACRVIHDLALAAGGRVKASGLLETSIGRSQTLAVATLPGAVHSDVAAAKRFLSVDPVLPNPRLIQGGFEPPGTPGIGCEPDEALMAAYLVREAEVPDIEVSGAG
jgi:O-succinylbenzoate synthase